MNAPRCTEIDYIAFLLAAQRVFSCTEAARCQPEHERAPAHDAFTRLLTRAPLDTEAVWAEVEPFVARQGGLLVLDDSTLDKPYGRRIELVSRHWSGKHKRVVWGINLQTLVWSDGTCGFPVDVRVYRAGGPTKNDGFREMLATAHERALAPSCVCFDAWYASLENLKAVRNCGWSWLTQLRPNRLVNADRTGLVHVSALEIAPEGRVVHLKGFGLVRVFRTVSRDGHAEHYATSQTEMSEGERASLVRQAWSVESYHRSLKQYCGVEGAHVRSATGQVNHLLLSIRAFVRLEVHRVRTGTSHFEAKLAIARAAMRAFLANPTLAHLPPA